MPRSHARVLRTTMLPGMKAVAGRVALLRKKNIILYILVGHAGQDSRVCGVPLALAICDHELIHFAFAIKAPQSVAAELIPLDEIEFVPNIRSFLFLMYNTILISAPQAVKQRLFVENEFRILKAALKPG